MNDVEGQKRRLPSWMLGVASSKSEIKEEKVTVVNQEDPQAKSRARRAARLEKEALVAHEDDQDPDSHGSSLLVKCESKKKKREVTKKEGISDVSTQQTEVGLELDESKRSKRKKGIREESCDDEVGGRYKPSAPKKRRTVKKPFENSFEESEDLSSKEDDEDLTLEDLMSIAKEIVKDDKNNELQRQKPPQTEIAEVEVHTQVNINEVADSYQNSADVCSRMTSDPAEDMLDLLIGRHLRRNPIENDKKKIRSTTDDMRLAQQSRIQKQSDVCVEKPVIPLAKKKTSLRDKVAAFLD
jgi:hypothetical protein